MGLNLDKGHVIAQLSDGMEVFLFAGRETATLRIMSRRVVVETFEFCCITLRCKGKNLKCGVRECYTDVYIYEKIRKCLRVPSRRAVYAVADARRAGAESYALLLPGQHRPTYEKDIK